jgi:hypothetical protein
MRALVVARNLLLYVSFAVGKRFFVREFNIVPRFRIRGSRALNLAQCAGLSERGFRAGLATIPYSVKTAGLNGSMQYFLIS